ncbi:MAG: hypothetical protein AAGA31_12300, partial [Bacteroidota bacterium]
MLFRLLTVLFTLGFGLTIQAQTIRQLSFADVGGADLFLDNIIEEDLEAAAGETHFIYELERGFPYLFSGQLRYDSTFHVEIRAQDGEGELPIILQGISSGGEVEDQLFRLNGQGVLTLKNLLLSGRTDQGAFNERIVRVDGENTVFVDSCLFDQAGQAAFRVSGGDEKLFITNSRFNRIGRPSNPDNGRFIDNRGDGLDTLVVRNCQITNVTSRAFRTGSGADANYVEFSGNT